MRPLPARARSTSTVSDTWTSMSLIESPGVSLELVNGCGVPRKAPPAWSTSLRWARTSSSRWREPSKPRELRQPCRRRHHWSSRPTDPFSRPVAASNIEECRLLLTSENTRPRFHGPGSSSTSKPKDRGCPSLRRRAVLPGWKGRPRRPCLGSVVRTGRGEPDVRVVNSPLGPQPCATDPPLRRSPR